MRISPRFQVSQIIPVWTAGHTKAGATPARLNTDTGGDGVWPRYLHDHGASELVYSLLGRSHPLDRRPRAQESPSDHVEVQTRAQ